MNAWKGSQVTYLGTRRWGIADVAEQELVIACPGKLSESRRIPPIGIVEIPLGW